MKHLTLYSWKPPFPRELYRIVEWKNGMVYKTKTIGWTVEEYDRKWPHGYQTGPISSRFREEFHKGMEVDVVEPSDLPTATASTK